MCLFTNAVFVLHPGQILPRSGGNGTPESSSILTNTCGSIGEHILFVQKTNKTKFSDFIIFFLDLKNLTKIENFGDKFLNF